MSKKKGLIFVLLIMLLMSSILASCDKKTAEPTETAEITSKPTATLEPVATPEPDDEKTIKNDDFSLGYENWGMYTEGTTAEFVPSDGTAVIPIEDVGNVKHAIQVYQDGLLICEECVYRVTFDMKSTIPRHVQVRIQKNGSPYTGYLEETVAITDEFETYTLEFTMTYESDPTSRLVFNMGNFEEDQALSSHSVEIDNVSVEMIGGDAGDLVFGEEKLNNIRINQIGYKINSNKIAVFADIDENVSDFSLVNADGEIVYTGTIGEAQSNPNSGESVRLGDFSDYAEAGVYHIELDGYDNSYDFEISDTVYDGVLSSTLKMFYYQRCGMDLDEEYAGDFAHPQCHTDLSVIFDTDNKIDVTGGWHDAGDFGRYVTPASKAVIDLLLAYESYPHSLADSSDIPESSNKTADILDEVKYELDFLLKMQDTEGGVYHKVTSANFTDTGFPNESNEQLILSPVSGPATADFAAIMAKTSSMALPFDDEYASNCLQSAELAWQWLQSNPDAHGFKNPAGIVTGEYGDNNSVDERFWAAAELYKATGKDEYHTYLKNSQIQGGMGWQDMGMYGVISYLSLPEQMQDADLYQKMMDELINTADEILANSKEDMYQISLATDDYVWGSNMGVANNAMLLLIANDYNPNIEYVDTAYEHLNYLLGKNAVDKSYITGFGTNQVHNIHHRITQTVGEVFPGLVIGGPNKNLEDPYAQSMLSDKAPAKCYADNEQSYSTNEITIYWNSPVVYLLSYFK